MNRLVILAALLWATAAEATPRHALPVASCFPYVAPAVSYGGHQVQSYGHYARYPYVGSVGYNPGNEVAEVAKDLVVLVKDLLKENRELRGALGGGPLALKEEPVHFQVAKVSCFSCHNQEDAAKKGGDFVLFDAGGRLKELSPVERGQVILRVSAGEMPPRKDALNDSDRLKLISGMTRAPAPAARAPELRAAPMLEAKE